MEKLKLLPVLALTLLATACGKLDGKLSSEKKSTSAAFATGTWLSGPEFINQCNLQHGGIVTGAYCIYVSDVKAPATPGYVQSEATGLLTLGQIASGAAIQVEGYSSGGSAQVAVNGVAVSAVPSAGGRPVTTNGGELQLLIRPGSYSGVKVYVYTCLNQAMAPARCPY